MKCGLLGQTLGHSYSPQIHAAFGSYSYELFEKQPEELEDFLRHGDFHGLNVTIPYKKAVIPYCAELSPTAAALGAVNTIVRRSDGTLIGHNTDHFGFQTMLEHSKLCVFGKKVLVLGSGGASNTAAAVLAHAGAEVIVISRNGENHYGNLHLHQDAAVIVNCTPVGMYPNTGASPIDLELFPHLEGVLDVIYNPARTKLLLDAEAKGLTACNGLLMLVAQAKESAEWFLGEKLPDGLLTSVYQSLKRQMENIVLIGMPGSGKSTVGKLLAEATGKEFVDADSILEKTAGKTIPEIFKTEGEAAFRTLETEVLKDLGKRSGIVLSTGGGCVTREENYCSLHQNGKIFWLTRDVAKLPTDGRPLSQTTDLSRMYEIRKPLYTRFADCIVANSGTAEETAKAILKLWEELP